MTRNMLARRPMKLQWVAVVLGLLALVLLAAPAHAAEFRGGEDTVRIGANETIDGDLFVGGTTIIIEGTVNGDVLAAGTTITIRGTVNGSVNAGRHAHRDRGGRLKAGSASLGRRSSLPPFGRPRSDRLGTNGRGHRRRGVWAGTSSLVPARDHARRRCRAAGAGWC